MVAVPALLAADRELIDGDIQRDLDQLIAEMTKGIRLGGGKMVETLGLVRLVGYLQEMSAVIGMLPAFGFSFRTTEDGAIQLVFDPRRLDADHRVDFHAELTRGFHLELTHGVMRAV